MKILEMEGILCLQNDTDTYLELFLVVYDTEKDIYFMPYLQHY